ncbi:WGxxGxxG family protein [Amycolatopsis sp. WQ 127309]|uniref:WGxxGxxG family protein n=1 Tax=Amycolatopsis sp. WQ 127309 TaxID=2932773 RepID=UPI001FF5A4B1|nr:WGxxGxxG family protein [Amycolatopsis sp. WQ 127309]UOZ10666.1 WGxxGxxG-CTERM domain-containing protein [Amycolatopsis sp. WQ 127309]
MTSSTARKLICGCVTTAVVALAGAAPAGATPMPAQSTVSHQADDDPNDGTSRGAAQDDDGDSGSWGLLGLLGLLGLAGLVRRGPKTGAMAGYPAASAGEPPVNAYPPAEPRRNPPGA